MEPICCAAHICTFTQGTPFTDMRCQLGNLALQILVGKSDNAIYANISSADAMGQEGTAAGQAVRAGTRKVDYE